MIAMVDFQVTKQINRGVEMKTISLAVIIRG